MTGVAAVQISAILQTVYLIECGHLSSEWGRAYLVKYITSATLRLCI